MRRPVLLVCILASVLAVPAAASAADTTVVAHVETPDGAPLPAGVGVTVLVDPPADFPDLAARRALDVRVVASAKHAERRRFVVPVRRAR